ncbi:hypothetical protein BG006_004049 [Podila minutissima]|uniref:FAD-binding domain-containing protein n=1 Tax=Podila minutissima TaxID=64525 RepID=A0A9P5VMK8_9FUNG|nr:hypothetical protein BG006_004049 [Podila minutissima]
MNEQRLHPKSSLDIPLLHIPNPSLPQSHNRPKVLIVGAGIGGLMLGALLQKGGMDFEIFDRATVIKPLGSAMSMGANLRPLFIQLGIYEEFCALGKPNIGMGLYDQNCEHLFSMNFMERETISGSREYIIARSVFYSLLLRQVAKERLHMGKRVVSFYEDEKGVTIHCADSTRYTGDILVGADGTYSTVRDHLYKTLKAKAQLPASDDAPLPFSCTCLVGQTVPLDPKEFPGANMEQEHSEFNFIIGKEEQYSWTTLTTKNDTICWFVAEYLDSDSAISYATRQNAGWGPGAAEAMCEQVRHLQVPIPRNDRNMTVGDLIDMSPKDSISKVVLEEKVFDTWFGGRTVLLGDACHKINPSGGAGALNAMHDAATLANWIYSLESTSLRDLDYAFEEYRKERMPRIKEAFVVSRMLRDVGGKTLFSSIVRSLFKWMPKWAWKKLIIKGTTVRSQVSFLPPVEDLGTVPPTYQPSLHKTRASVQQAHIRADMKVYNTARERWSRL